MTERILLRVEDVAARLSVPVGTVQRLIASGELESVEVSERIRRVSVDAVERYVAGLRRARVEDPDASV